MSSTMRNVESTLPSPVASPLEAPEREQIPRASGIARGKLAPIRFKRASTQAQGWNNLLLLTDALLDPALWVLTLWAVAFYVEGQLTPPYLILSLIVFSLTLPGTVRLQLARLQLIRSILADWGIVTVLLVGFGYVTGYLDLFAREAVLPWLIATPLMQFTAHLGVRKLAPSLLKMQNEPQRAVIVGINEMGVTLAQQLEQSPYISTRLIGFFDDRLDERTERAGEFSHLGKLEDLPAYVRTHRIEAIYISLPMVTQPRILSLLDALGDTTVSVHFVPDIFVTELMQGRMDSIGEVPVVTVCESPFTGLNGLVKRASDVVLSTLILIMISPVMLAIAVGIKLGSPGPVIFKQRRYGLNGEEILVNKFRSMHVCEDGGEIRQAQRNDSRITPFGAFLRKTSLDELPQFFNVLRGEMSIVGPRPHAVAHNELYRKVIKGYMVRHKVKPGITGWAQVNGWRGETDTLEKMKMRIDYDLAYLRHWSLRLDLHIILKTVVVVFKDRHAY